MMNTRSFRIDLVSDTATQPTAAMRQAMAAAEVGDEQRGEDPSVNRLCERVCALLNKEAALFLPSGTMCNQIAFLVHCRPGDEILAAEGSHVIDYEGAGATALAGAAIRLIQARYGIFSAGEVEAAFRPRSRKSPRTRVVVVEQTHNRGGGRVWPLRQLQMLSEVTRGHQLVLHMDGARLMNAAVAAGVAARDFAETADSVWLDLSKGLGCPVGAVLAGTKEFIEAAWTWKHRLGGAMRQSGVLAAAGLYALDHHVERLADDHSNARHLAERLRTLPGVVLDPDDIQSNLVFIDLRETGVAAASISAALRERGIRIGVEGEYRLRAVTHLHIDRSDIEEAADAFTEALSRLRKHS